jgi:hypothetical protein
MYKIIGSDHTQYGPVAADQVRQWIAEGRLDASTLLQPEGATDWKPLSAFPEFASVLASLPPGAAPPTIPVPIAGGPSHPKTNTMAATGFVLGLLSMLIGWLCCLAFLLSPLGFIFSVIGFTQIKRKPAEQTGKGLAIAGIILSVFGIIVSIVCLVLFWFGMVVKALQQNGAF